MEDEIINVQQYTKDLPIILYSKLVDVPDTPKRVKGIPDTASLEDVKVVIKRPNGDRHSIMDASITNSEGFGEWFTVTLNLNFTDESGIWSIEWIYNTSEGPITHVYSIRITEDLLIKAWCFQPLPIVDETIPAELRNNVTSK